MDNKAAEGNTKILDIASLVLMMGSILYSVSLFLKGNREQAIFVGLWPPTFLALGTLLKQTFGKVNSK